MKNKIILFYLIILIVGCSRSANQCIVAAEKYNILLVNADNPILIGIIGMKKSKYTAITDNGTIKWQYEKYYVTPNKVGLCNITVKTTDGKEYIVPFRVIPIGKITTSLLKRTVRDVYPITGISCYITDIDFDFKVNIISFNLSIKRNNNTIEEHINQGKDFDEITKKILDRCLIEDEVIFDKILVQFENGNTAQAESLNTTIKVKTR